jgi:hypothetical protein
MNLEKALAAFREEGAYFKSLHGNRGVRSTSSLLLEAIAEQVEATAAVTVNAKGEM